ncbi:hypothetical protein D7D25_04915 [Proteiniphilum sp. X52]|nr:hypothetical protein D7D25_04915 [Proteiniphilum sp. X52]
MIKNTAASVKKHFTHPFKKSHPPMLYFTPPVTRNPGWGRFPKSACVAWKIHLIPDTISVNH